MQGNLHV